MNDMLRGIENNLYDLKRYMLRINNEFNSDTKVLSNIALYASVDNPTVLNNIDEVCRAIEPMFAEYASVKAMVKRLESIRRGLESRDVNARTAAQEAYTALRNDFEYLRLIQASKFRDYGKEETFSLRLHG